VYILVNKAVYIIRVTLGPLYRFKPLGPPTLPGLPMASYATGLAASSGWLTIPVLHRHPCIWSIMCTFHVIHKTGNTRRIATPSEEDRATAIANTHEKIGEDRTCSSRDVLAGRRTHRQTHRHGHHNTSPGTK